MFDHTVPLSPPYPVRLRRRFDEAWRALRADHPDRRMFVVADRRLLKHQPQALSELSPGERQDVVAIAGGEASKSLRGLDRLVGRALDRRLDRQALVVAVGGGTVGDLTGAFAATYLRGLDWCPLATTVLALADSAVGGKTAVNSHGIKNLVGSFHQPVGVYGALEALGSLTRRHRVAGLAEVVKTAMIGDAELFETLEARGDELSERTSPLWFNVLGRSIELKSRVVAEDPREAGPRELLNFGHTLGHALETRVRPRLYHGEAVALGMIAATQVSESRGLAPSGTTSRLTALLSALGLPVNAAGLELESVLDAVGYDKKVRNRQVRMVLTEGIGSATFGHAVGWSEMSQVLLRLAGPTVDPN